MDYGIDVRTDVCIVASMKSAAVIDVSEALQR